MRHWSGDYVAAGVSVNTSQDAAEPYLIGWHFDCMLVNLIGLYGIAIRQLSLRKSPIGSFPYLTYIFLSLLFLFLQGFDYYFRELFKSLSFLFLLRLHIVSGNIEN